MVEHVFSAVAVGQWVVVLQKWLRCFLRWDAGRQSRVVRISVCEAQRRRARVHEHSCGSARAACCLCTVLARV